MKRFACIALFIIAATASRIAAAEDNIDIDVDTGLNPQQAIGFVISKDGATQRIKTAWKKLHDGVITVSVPLKSGERSEGTVVTAMVVGDDGKIAFGNSKAASIQAFNASMYSLPQCTLQIPSQTQLETTMNWMQSLVQVRSALRGNLQLKLAGILQGDFLTKLSKLEHGFGLDRGTPLDPALPPVLLEDRLTRLEQAIENYHAKKAAAEQPAAKK